MGRATKLVALSSVAAILAACSATGSNSIPSTSPQSGARAPYRMQVGSDRQVMMVFYNQNTERSGLVRGGIDPSQATLLRGGGIQTDGKTRAAGSSGNLLYHNGPVQTAPKIYVTFWGSAWNSTGDPAGEKTYYTNFISGVGGSQWLSSVTQYTQTGGAHVGNSSGSYAGSWVDTTNSVPNLNTRSYQSYLAAEAQRAAAHFGDYSSNASYVILLAHGVKVYQFAGNYYNYTAYCAWHSSTSSTGGRISYTNFPYQSDAGGSCGVGSVNNPGTNDGVSIVGGHEQAETETDPQPNTGWVDSSNAENGDKCAWMNLQDTSFSTGTFPTQPLWSNAVSGCVQ